VARLIKSILCLAIIGYSAFIYMPSYTPTLKPTEPLKTPVNVLDVHCLASALHFEAGNQGEIGQKAVADVVLNRAQEWNKSVCAIIWQPYQFSYLNGKATIPKFPTKFLAQAEKYLEEHYAGLRKDITGGSKWFMTVDTHNWLSDKLHIHVVIGEHKFMREKR